MVLAVSRWFGSGVLCSLWTEGHWFDATGSQPVVAEVT